MTNAKEEFLGHVRDRKVLCAEIQYGCWNDKEFNLPVGYTEEEGADFVDALDFEYDAGYGFQELFGTIWYTDGTWTNRDEYNGKEWWKHYQCPEIPKELSTKFLYK